MAICSKVAEIQVIVSAGVGITLNSLYINPRQLTFQLPLRQEIHREGLPIEGFCVAAGIPTTEKAAEIIKGLTQTRIKNVSFKPGLVYGICQVINIAVPNPRLPIVLQWTGGHHSCEDVHQPILLHTYSSIHQHPTSYLSVALVSVPWPYLTGN